MSDAEALFTVLRQSAGAGAVAAIEQLVGAGTDRALNRINVIDFAAKSGVGEEGALGAFLHAARLGIFDLSWNVLCPGCSGVLDANTTLKSMNHEEYSCALCAAGYAPTLDEMVEVTFTVNPRTRRIAAHTPHELPISDYYTQIFWRSGIDLPDASTFDRLIQDITLAFVELPPC